LDKCLSFKRELTVENVLNALGISDYECFSNLLMCLRSDNDKSAIEIIEQIYNQGKDLKLFIKQFIQFLLDVCKYAMYSSYDYIQIPNTIDLSIYANSDSYNAVLNLLDEFISLSNNIKYEQNPKILIESKILLLAR